MSFKVMVNIPGENPTGNAMRFATYAEADGYGWVTDPVTHTFADDKASPISETVAAD